MRKRKVQRIEKKKAYVKEARTQIQESPKGFSLIKAIKASPFYGKTGNDAAVRMMIQHDLGSDSSLTKKSLVKPGQLVLFDYFEPKTQEDLEYYDASPCTIFFGLVSTEQGKRYLGFNIHYYPRSIRYQVMNRIFEIYKPVYSKYFTTDVHREIDGFTYQYLMDQLKKAKLDFGVRMYIPKLCASPITIPPNYWQVAVFTEGWFKKRTRQAIINYWNNFRSNYKG